MKFGFFYSIGNFVSIGIPDDVLRIRCIWQVRSLVHTQSSGMIAAERIKIDY